MVAEFQIKKTTYSLAIIIIKKKNEMKMEIMEALKCSYVFWFELFFKHVINIFPWFINKLKIIFKLLGLCMFFACSKPL